MKKLRFLVSLTTNDNDYQIEQAKSAEQMARKLGMEIQIVYADNDAITQSTQILKVVQADDKTRQSSRHRAPRAMDRGERPSGCALVAETQYFAKGSR